MEGRYSDGLQAATVSEPKALLLRKEGGTMSVPWPS